LSTYYESKEVNQRIRGSVFDCISGLAQFIKPVIVEPVIQWIEENIDLTDDVTADHNGLVSFDKTPHLREPISCWEDENVLSIIAMAVEQLGKSSIWRWPLPWLLEFYPASNMIVYPSDPLAQRVNKDTVEPLMKCSEKIRKELERPFAMKAGEYRLSDSVTYFQGAGSPIITTPVRFMMADEINDWPEALKEQNAKDIIKRTRTFMHPKICIVCTPSVHGQPIEVQFYSSSMGYWHLSCIKCGHLHPSYDISRLEWSLADDEKTIVPDSIRYICKECKHKHHEENRYKLNQQGQYVHKHSGRERNRGFQWGALASLMPNLTWIDIAEAQMKAGRKSNLVTQQDFDNSYRGLPLQERTDDREEMEIIKSHFAEPKEFGELLGLFMIADTQDDGWFWIVRAIDTKMNSMLVENGFVDRLSIPEDGKRRKDEDGVEFKYLEDVWEKSYLGFLCIAGMVDEGGHFFKEVTNFVKPAGLYSYKGDTRTERFKVSKTNSNRILANATVFKQELLYQLYTQHDRTNNYWMISEDVDPEYLKQMEAVRPNTRVKEGHHFRNYTNGDRADHYFDCDKMFIVMVEFAKENFTDDSWLTQHIPFIEKEPVEKKKRRRPKGKAIIY